MTVHSRLISSFVVPAGQAIAVDHGAGAVAVSLTAGTYYMQDDGSADDFCAMLAARLFATFGGFANAWLVYIQGVDIQGIGSLDPTYADGRLTIEHTSAITVCAADALWTYPARILGYSGNLVATEYSPGHFRAIAPWVHRYGWYPQAPCLQDIPRSVLVNMVEFSSDGRAESCNWTDDSGREAISLDWNVIGSPLVRTRAAADALRVAGMGLTKGDLNCSLERFGLDLSYDPSRHWLYYPDASDDDGCCGPYIWPDRSSLWSDPLSMSSIQSAAGESWRVGLNGVSYVP